MPLVLTARERAALEGAAARERRVSAGQRYRAVVLAADAGPEAAVRALGCARSSLYAWLAAWRRAGLSGVAVRPRSGGRPPLLGRAGTALLERLLRESPRARGWPATTWTAALLRAELARGGYPVGDKTLRRALHRLGWTWRPTGYAASPPDAGRA